MTTNPEYKQLPRYIRFLLAFQRIKVVVDTETGSINDIRASGEITYVAYKKLFGVTYILYTGTL